MRTKLINYILEYDTTQFLGLFSPKKYCSGNYVSRPYNKLKKGDVFNINSDVDRKTKLPIFYKLDNIIVENNSTLLFVNDGDIITINSSYNKRIKVIL